MTKVEHSLRARDQLKALMGLEATPAPVEPARVPLAAPAAQASCKSCWALPDREAVTRKLAEARALLAQVVAQGHGQAQAVPAEARL